MFRSKLRGIRPREIKNTTVVLSAVFVTLLISELGLRFFYPSYQLTQKPLNSAGYSSNEEYYERYANVSKMQYYSKTGYRPIPFWTSEGIVNNDLGMRASFNSKKINKISDFTIISGGSTAWGAGVKQQDMYTEFMRDTFSSGVGGYLFANEFTFMKDVISKKLKIKKWVSLSGWNDIYAAYRGSDYYISPDMFNLEAIIYNNSKNNFWPHVSENLSETNFTGFNETSIKLWWLFRIVWGKITAEEIVFWDKIVARDVIIKKDVYPMDYNKFWLHFSEELLLANYWAKKNKINFIFALQPSLYSTIKPLSKFEKKILIDSKKSYMGLYEHFDEFYTRMKKDIKELSKKNNFLFIEVDQAFKDSSAKESYFVDHVHFGSVGNKVIGEFLKCSL